MTPRERKITVFLASPSDLGPERRAFREQIDELNEGFGSRKRVTFVARLWEDALASTGGRVQALLDQGVEECDVFILALHRRWGQPAPDSPETAYTEEEFRCALDRFERTGSPEIFVFLKDIDAESMADPGPQLQKVLAFRKELDRTRTVLYRTFADPHGFRRLVDLHLRGFVDGVSRAPVIVERLPLRMELVDRVSRALTERKRGDDTHNEETSEKSPDERALELARSAARAFEDGRTEEARQAFAQVVVGTTNGEALFLAFDFYRRVGDQRAAEDVVRFVLACSGPDAENVDTAAALAQLGNLYLRRGDLEQARRLLEKSLKINRDLGCLKGIADQHTRLGMVLARQGEWRRARQEFEQAIELNERIERPRGVSFARYQLARELMARGELALAEKELRNALTLDRRREEPWAIARDQEALAEIHAERDEPERAVRAYRKAVRLFREANDAAGELACLHALDELE